MSLYADYLRERSNIEILEKDYGFVTYSIDGEECYIRDIFVEEVQRRKYSASTMADEVKEIARIKGCKYLTGSICPTAKGADMSLKVLIGYGMKLHSAVTNLIIFKKDIV